MSVVTNLIVKLPLDTHIEEVNEYFKKNEIPPLVSMDDDSLPKGWYGGTKFLECNLFVGAFNYLNLEDFIEHLRSVKWKKDDYEKVQLIVQEQEDDEFRIINV